jgi:hypothetical protein
LLKSFLLPLKPESAEDYYEKLGEDDPKYKKAVAKLEREISQLCSDETKKKSQPKKGQIPIQADSDTDSSDTDTDNSDSDDLSDYDHDDINQFKLPSDWESLTSDYLRSLSPIDPTDKTTILSEKLSNLQENKKDEYLKAYFERFGTFQLNLIAKILEHPKMYLRPVMHEEAFQLLEFTLYKYFWGNEAEQALCLRIYDLLVTYLTREPKVAATNTYHPPKVSIVELGYLHGIVFIMEQFRPKPTPAICALILKFCGHFDYRNTIVRITDQKQRQGIHFVPERNLNYKRIFGAQKVNDELYDMYITKVAFLEDPELRSLYAKFHSQIVLPEELVESVRSGLDALVGELLVETPNENRMLFEAEYVANMIGRAVVHCEQILIYDVGEFYEELRLIVKDKAVNDGVSCVSPMVKSKMQDLLVMIGFEEDDMVVKKLLDV